MDIGHKIKTTRERQGISMNALSRRSGAAQSAISEIENGKRQPTFEMMERIVHGLGLTLSEFFAEDSPDMPPDLRHLLNQAESLTPPQREKLAEFIKSLK